MKSLPAVVEAQYYKAYAISLTFDDGVKKIVDFTLWLEGPVFEPLKDLKVFKRFFVDGGTIAWPNGADIAPETLYEAAEYGKSTTPKRALI